MSIVRTPTVPAPPTLDDLLLPFEQQNMTEEYKEYYRFKRNNFFATIRTSGTSGITT